MLSKVVLDLTSRHLEDGLKTRSSPCFFNSLVRHLEI